MRILGEEYQRKGLVVTTGIDLVDDMFAVNLE
jgi:hypothetical protein